MLSRSVLASFAAVLYTTPPAMAYEKLPSALAGLSPADFAAEVHIEDDPLASVIVVSTHEGYKRGRSLKGALADDVHLRALIDRGTGKVTWQVWHDLAYVGGRKEVDAVHYHTAAGVQETRPFHVEHRLDRCPPTDGVGYCGEAMTIGFELPEATVREIAATYASGSRSRSPWRLRFKDAGDRDVTGGLAPAEAAGILHAVETRRRGRN